MGESAELVESPSKEEVSEAFHVFDLHNNGYMHINELTQVVKTLGEGLNDTELAAMSMRPSLMGTARLTFDTWSTCLPMKTKCPQRTNEWVRLKGASLQIWCPRHGVFLLQI